MATEAPPPFQLHLEPDSPLELSELTGALSAIAHQFEIFSVEAGLHARAKDAKLLVSSVRPGSIDIGLLPDLATAGTLLAPLIPLAKFAEQLKKLIDAFRKKDEKPAINSIRDCEDAAAIAGPIANHGGTQSISVHNGDIYQAVVIIDALAAREVVSGAIAHKAALQFPDAERHQRVSMVWKGLYKDKARTEGKQSPDKALIEEIDVKPRPVFFEDEVTYLKDEMIGDEANPYHRVYFVDVVVSRVSGKVTSYRVTGFHGSDELDTDGEV